MPTHVDLVQLTRDASSLRSDVQLAIESQTAVVLHLHRVIGTPREGDAHRWETIARARNEGKKLGSSPWVMFVDDDVILGPDCVASLLAALQTRPEFAAFAADYDGEMKTRRGNWDYPGHVGMGATLFRRERLQSVTFRWEDDKCECQCCCDDLRRAGFAIGYLPGAIAWHKPASSRRLHRPTTAEAHTDESPKKPGRVLAAFDRNHLLKFRRQFLRTLRSSGNCEQVTAIAYGLGAGEARALARMPDVEVIAIPESRIHPSIRRLRDFPIAIADWPDDTPVAFWDAGDVLFQSSLQDLWDLVRVHPDELLVVQEPFRYPENTAISAWISAIQEVEARRRAFELLSTNIHLNTGFVAGTARTLAGYLREAQRLIDSAAVRGLGYGTDQVVLNLYCHSNLGAWREIAEGWNYCLAGRNRRDFRLRSDGYTVSTIGSPVHVVHGNGGYLREVEWYYVFLAANAGR